MNYKEIKLSIYESFENGEIDEIEKNILLERLEEKEIEDESITLEKAMDKISSYLYEKTSNDIKKTLKDVENLRKRYAEYGDKRMVSILDAEIKRLKQKLISEGPTMSKKDFDDLQSFGNKFFGFKMK